MVTEFLIKQLHRFVLSKMTKRHPKSHPYAMVAKSPDLLILGMCFLAVISLIAWLDLPLTWIWRKANG